MEADNSRLQLELQASERLYNDVSTQLKATIRATNQAEKIKDESSVEMETLKARLKASKEKLEQTQKELEK